MATTTDRARSGYYQPLNATFLLIAHVPQHLLCYAETTSVGWNRSERGRCTTAGEAPHMVTIATFAQSGLTRPG